MRNTPRAASRAAWHTPSGAGASRAGRHLLVPTCHPRQAGPRSWPSPHAPGPGTGAVGQKTKPVAHELAPLSCLRWGDPALGQSTEAQHGGQVLGVRARRSSPGGCPSMKRGPLSRSSPMINGSGVVSIASPCTLLSCDPISDCLSLSMCSPSRSAPGHQCLSRSSCSVLVIYRARHNFLGGHGHAGGSPE